MSSTAEINPRLGTEAIEAHLESIDEMLQYAEEVSSVLGEDEEQQELFVDVVFLPPVSIQDQPHLSELYEAHIDEIALRLMVHGHDVLTEEVREKMLEPTRAEVLASCMGEITIEDVRGDTEHDAFTAFTIWLIRDLLDDYMEDHPLFALEMEDIFTNWGQESESKLQEMFDLLVEDYPREVFINGRQYYLPSEVQGEATNPKLASFEGW